MSEIRLVQVGQSDLRCLLSGIREASLSELLEAFLRIEMLGRSDQTRLWYQRCLLPMIACLGPDRPLLDVMEADLIEWYEGLSSRGQRYSSCRSRPAIEGGLSKETLRGYVRAVRRFFGWIKKRGILEVDLSADLRPPSKPRRKKKGVCDLDAEMILAAAKDNPRDYAVLKFMETAGVRRGGVANLLLSDLSLDAGQDRLRRRIMVREKGDKERPVFVTQAGLDALIAWLAVRPAVTDDHVFLGRKIGGCWKPLSPAGVSAILRRYKERLDITGKVSPHQWRHRFCRKRLQDGLNLKQVSQLAGHESVVVTAEFYSDSDLDELQTAYDDHFKS